MCDYMYTGFSNVLSQACVFCQYRLFLPRITRVSQVFCPQEITVNYRSHCTLHVVHVIMHVCQYAVLIHVCVYVCMFTLGTQWFAYMYGDPHTYTHTHTYRGTCRLGDRERQTDSQTHTHTHRYRERERERERVSRQGS